MTREASTSAGPRTAAVIMNPAARGAVTAAAVRAAARALEPRWTVAVEEPEDARAMRACAADHARRGTQAIVACGGDGAVLDILNGLRDAGPNDAEVGLLPAGTGNVWAREAHIPFDLDRALALLDDGARRRVDLGLARIGAGGDPTRFLLVCSAGLDAAIVASVERRRDLKRRIGRLAFALPALVAGATWRGAGLHVEVDREPADREGVLMALVANTRRYGGVARVADGARIDDGLLDVVTIEENLDAGLSGRGMLALEGLCGGLDTRDVEGFTYRRGARVVITPSRALPVQADGDHLGECRPDAPLIVDVEPSAVTMIVGPGRNPLWGGS